MTPEEMARMKESQAFFDREGYWPMGPIVPRKVSPRAAAAAARSSEEIRRFPRDPRKIESHAELQEFIQGGQGFVFNNRDDRKMLHRASCESLEVMSTRAYEKLFFEDLELAQGWLDWKYGAGGWEVCGRCRY